MLTSYFYRRSGGGGVSAHINGLCRRLRGRGHVAMPVGYAPPEMLPPDSEALLGHAPVRHPVSSARMGAFHRDINRAIKPILMGDPSPDLLHAHNTSGVFPALCWPRLPVVTTVHNITADSTPGVGMKEKWRCYRERLLLQMAVKHSDHVVIVSEQVRRLASALGVALPANRTHVIPPGIDTALFGPGDYRTCRQQLGIGSEYLVLSVQRMVPRKGAMDLLEAVKRLLPTLPSVRIMVVGDGPVAPAFDRAVLAEGLKDYVTRVSHVPQDELATYYRASDVFVNTTHEAEAYGLVTGEAAACGLPVICSEEAAATGVLRDEACLVYRDPEELSRHAWTLLASPDRGRSFGQAARGCVASLDEVTTQLENLYHEAVDGPRSRPSATRADWFRLRAALRFSDLLYALHASSQKDWQRG